MTIYNVPHIQCIVHDSIDNTSVVMFVHAQYMSLPTGVQLMLLHDTVPLYFLSNAIGSATELLGSSCIEVLNVILFILQGNEVGIHSKP